MHKNIWHSSAFFTLLYGKVLLFSSLQRYINNIYVFKLTISVFVPIDFFYYCPQIVLLFTPFTITLLWLLFTPFTVPWSKCIPNHLRWWHFAPYVSGFCHIHGKTPRGIVPCEQLRISYTEIPKFVYCYCLLKCLKYLQKLLYNNSW